MPRTKKPKATQRQKAELLKLISAAVKAVKNEFRKAAKKFKQAGVLDTGKFEYGGVGINRPLDMSNGFSYRVYAYVTDEYKNSGAKYKERQAQLAKISGWKKDDWGASTTVNYRGINFKLNVGLQSSYTRGEGPSGLAFGMKTKDLGYDDTAAWPALAIEMSDEDFDKIFSKL